MKIDRLSFPLEVVPADVGVRVALERERLGWTKSRLASKAKLSRWSIYRLEEGRRPSRADTLFRVAHALDIPIGSLVPAWPEWVPIKGTLPGEATRERRKALGMTIAELASKVGVSEATLSRHERGIVASPTFVRREGDDYVACSEKLREVLYPAKD